MNPITLAFIVRFTFMNTLFLRVSLQDDLHWNLYAVKLMTKLFWFCYMEVFKRKSLV